MPEDYMTYTRVPAFPPPTVEDLLRMKKELEAKMPPDEDLVLMLVPKGARVVILTKDNRILSTKEAFKPDLPTLWMTIPPLSEV